MTDGGNGIGGFSLGMDELTSGTFNPFAKPEIDTSIISSTIIEARPVSTLQHGGPFTFVFPPDHENWTHADSIRLSGRVKLMKVVGNVDTALADNEDVACVNNYIHSLFKSVDVRLNDTDLSDPNSTSYGFKSYFETLLSYGKAAKQGRLSNNGFDKDLPEKYDVIANEAYTTRKAIFKNSNWVYFCINLHTDLTTVRKYLPPNIKIEVVLNRASDNFTIQTFTPALENSKLMLDDLVMQFRRYKPNQKIIDYYNSKMICDKFCSIPIDRSLIKSYVVPMGTMDLSHYNFIRGTHLPDQIIVAMIDEDAYNGSAKKSPYNFKTNDISEAYITVNGRRYPYNGYKYNIGDGNYVKSYIEMLDNLGISNEDRDLWITKEDYIGGCFILAYDRSTDLCNRYHRHNNESGSIDINIILKTVSTVSVQVVVYATYSSDLVITKDNKVQVEKL